MVTAARPFMPGYGVLPADEGTGLLPWAWAAAKLRESHDYWLASGWPDGTPHLMPVWGIWTDDAFWFSSAAGSRKVRNLAATPRCTVAIADALDPVVVDGVAEVRGDVRARRRFLDALNAKYDVEYGLDFLDGVSSLCLRVQPVTAFGLQQADFAGSPTRWAFSAPG